MGSTVVNPDGTTSNSDGMSCLLQKQTSMAKSGMVAEVEASAETTEQHEQVTESGSDVEGVKKHHHHHHERVKEQENAHVPTTTDEWADYLVDGTTTSVPAAPGAGEETPVSEESEPSWFWKFLCWIDFLHWFTPVPADEVTTTAAPLTGNVSNVSDGANETSNDTSTEAPTVAEGNATEDSTKTELNNTNTTKDAHAPLPASLEEFRKEKKARHSKASKKSKKKHSSHNSD